MKTILQRTLKDYLFSDRADTRASGSLWLLELVEKSGDHPLIKRNLHAIQHAFSLLLGDNNDVVQEVAAKGLVLVYESGDASMKKLLVGDLVGTVSKLRSAHELKLTGKTCR